MRKTIRNGIDRRAVYKFICTGSCGKKKFTYVYDRAKSGKCLSCTKKQGDPNQARLFDETQVFTEDQISVINAIEPDAFFPVGNFNQEHFDALNEANRQENERLDSMKLDIMPIKKEGGKNV